MAKWIQCRYNPEIEFNLRKLEFRYVNQDRPYAINKILTKINNAQGKKEIITYTDSTGARRSINWKRAIAETLYDIHIETKDMKWLSANKIYVKFIAIYEGDKLLERFRSAQEAADFLGVNDIRVYQSYKHDIPIKKIYHAKLEYINIKDVANEREVEKHND